VVGHHAGHRPRQEDPQQQPAHDPAHHAAARFGWRQVGGQGNEDLHRHRTEPDQQRNQEKGIGCGGERGPQQAGDGHQGGGDHQATVFQEVAQGHQEKQAQGVTDLGQGHDQAGQGAGQADIRRNQLDDRLGVVDVGNNGAAAKGKQQHHASGHCRAGSVQRLGGGSHRGSLGGEKDVGEVKRRAHGAVERAGQ
jgi:hypothetical protein